MKIVQSIGNSRGIEELLAMRILQEVRRHFGGYSWKVCV